MAWPLTPFRTMVDASTFWDQALGNALQSGVNSLYSGGLTVRSLQADGVGANSSSLAAGAIQSSAQVSRSIWIPAACMQYNDTGDHWAFVSYYWQSGAATWNLAVPISQFLPYVASTSNGASVTQIVARVATGGAGGLTLAMYKINNLSVTSSPTPTQIGSTATSSGTGGQSLTVTGSFSPTNDTLCYALLTSGNAADVVFGLQVNLTQNVF